MCIKNQTSIKIAMELLVQGKKVRRVDWPKRLYITLSEKGNIVDNRGQYFKLYIDIQDEWEEYIEIVEFHEVIEHILNGGKAQRLNQDNQLTTVFLNEDGYLMRETIIHNRTNIDLLHKEDLNATNWNLI